MRSPLAAAALVLAASSHDVIAFSPSAPTLTPCGSRALASHHVQQQVGLPLPSAGIRIRPGHHHHHHCLAGRQTAQSLSYAYSGRTSLTAAATASASNNDDGKNSAATTATIQRIASTSLLVAADVAIRRLFQAKSIAFPSSLAGCGFLFAALLALHTTRAEWGDAVHGVLAPGAAVLAKWLPVFFVPSLVTLPLAQSMGSGVELAKVATVIGGGFLFTLFTTAGSVLAVRKLMGGSGDTSNDGDDGRGGDVDIPTAPTPAAAPGSAPLPKAFADSTANGLTALAATSGALATIATRSGSAWGSPLQSAYLLFTTLATFVFGARLPKSFSKVVHPLVTCTSLTWLGVHLMARLVGGGATFLSLLRGYKAGTLAPMAAGAGDVLLFMLGPAVVALACQMYDRKRLMRENIAEVGTAVGVSSFGGLLGTAAMVRALGIANPTIRLCLLSRNITSPLAMSIAAILGADISLAVSMVVITGLIGANFGASILDAVGIKDAVARGLGIGAAAHGLGTAAFANEKDAFPFAAISMALTGALTTVLVSLPAIKKVVLNLALGA